MSKMFTVLLALIVAAAGSVAGYVYYTGESLTPSLPCAARTTAAISDDSDGCPLCAAAKQKSCCSGESSVRLQAMNAIKASTTETNCCSLGESLQSVTASVIGGSAFTATTTNAVPSCCEAEAKTEAALAGLVGVAAFGTK